MSGRFITSDFRVKITNMSAVTEGSAEYNDALLEIVNSLAAVIAKAAYIEKNFEQPLAKPVVAEVFSDYVLECKDKPVVNLPGFSVRAKTQLTTFCDISKEDLIALGKEILHIAIEDARRAQFFSPIDFIKISEARFMIVFVEC